MVGHANCGTFFLPSVQSVTTFLLLPEALYYNSPSRLYSARECLVDRIMAQTIWDSRGRLHDHDGLRREELMHKSTGNSRAPFHEPVRMGVHQRTSS